MKICRGSMKFFALLVLLVVATPVSAATYVLPPAGSPISPFFGLATRVGTTATADAVGVAGRVIFTGSPTTVTGTFGAPVDNVNFGGGGQMFSASGGIFGSAVPIVGTYTFTPQSRGLFVTSAQITSNASVGNANPSFTLAGLGVGPEFNASGAGVTSTNTAADTGNSVAPGNLGASGSVDFGTIDAIVGPFSSTVTMDIANLSTDILTGLLSDLADLNILDIEIVGPDADAFSLDPSDVADLLSGPLKPGDSLSLEILFSSNILGDKLAYLNIYTDQFGDVGEFNQVFSFQLNGVVTPEPASLALWGIGAAVAGISARRRRKQQVA